MRYSELYHGYLKDGIERIAEGLKTSSDLKVRTIYRAEEQMTGHFWDLQVVDFVKERLNSNLQKQIWTVQSQLVYEDSKGQMKIAVEKMLTVLPQAHNYMDSHLRLIFEDEQSAIQFLLIDEVEVTITAINPGNAPGMVLQHRLPYLIPLEQE